MDDNELHDFLRKCDKEPDLEYASAQMAKLFRIFYEALLREGFTEEQALTLTTYSPAARRGK